MDKAQENHNYGIDILRVILTFTVILYHFWDAPNSTIIDKGINMLRGIAAPSFFLLSVYLTSKHIISSNNAKLRNRITRLRIPFYFWGIVAWLALTIVRFSPENKNELIMSLLWQMFTGHAHGVNAPLWYMIVLCWITTIYFFIFKAKNRQVSIAILSLLTAGSFCFQYAGWNYWLFGDLSFEVRYPLGRIVEMIPYASAGLLLWWIEKKISKKWLFLIIGLVGLVLYALLSALSTIKIEGFDYSGVPKLIGSLSFVMFFIALPLQNLSTSHKSLIQKISNYTLGIYCMHYIIGQGINMTIKIQSQILQCVIIYICGYVVSMLLSKVKHLECLVK